MTKFYAIGLTVAAFTCCASLSAEDKVYVPEQPTNQRAVYNAADNTVTVAATAPSKTEFDWDTWEQVDLPYISYILVERHESGTPWQEEAEVGRVAPVEPGKNFQFVDYQVEVDKKYEYRLTCYVDETSGYSCFASVYTGGATPGAVEAFTATTADHLATSVDFSVTAPKVSDKGETLTASMSIEIQSYADFTYTAIHTIKNVNPGETKTWALTELETGSYHFRAVAKVGTSGIGEGKEADVYVGLDYPGVPENFSCVPSGESVSITWDAPAKGGRGGSYDPASTTYTITRRFIDGTTETAALEVKGYEYTDKPGFDEETTVAYSIVASNAAGTGIEAPVHAPVSVGNPTVLPFNESFAAMELEHRGWTTESTQDDPYYTYEAWEFVASGTMYYFPTDEYLAITPYDGDGGFASCKFFGHSVDGQTESLTSPRIATDGMQKVDFKFAFYDVCSDASGNVVRASVSKDGGQWEELFVSMPAADTQAGWREVSLPVVLDGDCSNIRVRIDAVRHNGPITNVYVDAVSVSVPAGAIGEVGADIDADASDAEYFTLQGIRVESPTSSGIYIMRRGNAVAKIAVK